MKPILLSLLIIALLTTLSCSSCKKETPNPDSLPPTTQTGANTLGFLLNGQPWKPQGFTGGSSNLSLDIDFGFNNGIFNIASYKLSDNSTFTIGISDSLNFLAIPSTLFIGKNSLLGISFTKDTCEYFTKRSGTTGSGSLTITKLDKTARIISGTFYATLAKQGCDTIKITDGRFDMKY
jgi:hypothetical protein